MRRSLAVTMLGLAGLLACATERYVYAPVHVTSASIGGEPATVYKMPPGEQGPGEVRVATFGIAALAPEGVEDSTLPAVHLALVLSNRTQTSWSVDAAGARVELSDHGARSSVAALTLVAKRPERVEVPAGETRRVDLYFPLPSAAHDASSVPAFDLVWSIDAGGHVYPMRTPFERFLASPPLREPELTPGQVPGTEPLPGTESPYRWAPPRPAL